MPGSSGGMSLAASEKSEQTRKVLRYVSEAVRRIEERHQAANKVEGVFTLELLTLRSRLRELSTKLVTLDPVQLGTKAMEVYWRKAYHEPVALARQLCEGDSPNKVELALLEAHLGAGIGHYHSTISTLAARTSWSSSAFALDFGQCAVSSYGFSSATPKKIRVEEGEEAWIEGAIVRCFVCLGDLGRYLVEFCNGAAALPARYYTLALRVRPNAGLPYTQLGTLAGDRGEGLERLFYYLRAAACQNGGEGGEANLRRLLEKKRDLKEGKGAEMVASLQRLVAAVEKKEEQEAVTSACQDSLAHLHYLLGDEVEEQLEGPWLALVIATMVTLQSRVKSDEAGDYRRALCQAWLLALLSHIAQRVTSLVGRAAWGAGWQPRAPHLPSLEDPLPETAGEKVDGKKKRNRLEELLRRRRRLSGSSDEEEGSDDDELDNEQDEDSEDDDEIYQSDSEVEISDRSDLLNSSDSDSDLDVVIEEEEVVTAPEPTVKDIANAAEATGLMPALRLLLAWLSAPLADCVLAQTGPGSDQLWNNLAAMCTTLTSCDVKRLSGALPEDWLLRGLAGSEEDWDKAVGISNRPMVRLARLAEARTWLCSHSDSKIAWSEEHKMAYLRQQEEEKQELVNKKEKMKHMAELWLRQEVKELEEEVVTDNLALIVVDGAALAQGLPIVRRAASFGRCNIIVPAVAVHRLDFLKRSERGARDAIRWLERELGRGNSRLRAQGEGELKKLEDSSYPRQRDRTAWQRFQLLECVNYFLSSGTAATLVTADPEILSGEAELPTLEGDWKVEDLESFGSKNGWKPSPEGGSRKRYGGRRGRGKLGSPADKESSKG